MNERMKLEECSVKVPSKGSFPHNGQLTAEPTYTITTDSIAYQYNDVENFVFSPVAATTKPQYIFLNSGMKDAKDGGEPFFVIPGSDVKIELVFADYTNSYTKDGKEEPGYRISKTYNLADFKLDSATATLGRAKNTRLQINIVGHNVGITATAEAWVEKGVYRIDID